MQYMIIAIIFLALMLILSELSKRKMKILTDETKQAEKQNLPIEGAYKPKWLFSYNEKDAYHKLKEIADQIDYYVFAKVRLLDLVEPIHGNPKYKTHFYKIQAKHVDFVICDQKLVARCIIELDDRSHAKKERKERDDFVDAVLSSTGYQIIHTYGITPEITKQIKAIIS